VSTIAVATKIRTKVTQKPSFTAPPKARREIVKGKLEKGPAPTKPNETS